MIGFGAGLSSYSFAMLVKRPRECCIFFCNNAKHFWFRREQSSRNEIIGIANVKSITFDLALC